MIPSTKKPSKLSSYYNAEAAGPDFAQTKKDISAASKETETALMAKYGAARRKLKGQQTEVGRQVGQGMDRLAAVSGGAGGAIEKARAQTLQKTGQQFADVEAGMAASEGETLAKLGDATQQQLTAVDEAERGRAQQREQYKAGLDFQQDSLAAQMDFQWAEFNENLRTNFINGTIALKEAGINNANDWARIDDLLARIYSDQNIPRSGGGKIITGNFGTVSQGQQWEG